MSADPTACRVTLICRCSADYAEGYGATMPEAREEAYRFWKTGGHKLADVRDEIHEVIVQHDGGSHYETDSFEFKGGA